MFFPVEFEDGSFGVILKPKGKDLTLILPYNLQKVGMLIDYGLCESDSLQKLILPKGLKVVGGIYELPSTDESNTSLAKSTTFSFKP